MDTKFTTTFILVHIYLQTNIWIGNSASWDYDDQKHWCSLDQGCCGKKQSPIDLKSGLTAIVMEPFTFINYEMVRGPLKFTNNGHTVQVSFDEGNYYPRLKGGGLKDEYKMHSFHFHWGDENDYGSEHTFDGIPTALELHIVHFKVKFDNIEAAANSKEPDAIAVLGVLYDVNDKKANAAIPAISSKIPDIHYKNQENTVEFFSLRKLLPTSTSSFYRYIGSLTTPPCNEAVVWTVFKYRSYVSEIDILLFRSTHESKKSDAEEKKLSINFRKIQKTNGREVIFGETKSSTSCLCSSFLGRILCGYSTKFWTMML